MTDHSTELSEREEIEALLPWYATGRLGAGDHARVESYLAAHPDMRFQLDLIREEQAGSIAANESLRTSRSGAVDRLMASLPAQRPGLAERLGRTGFGQALTEFFTAPSVRGVRMAALAAAALVLVQGAVIATLVLRDGATYHAASGQGDDGNISALVQFADNVRLPDVTLFLAAFDAAIVDGPKPGGLYRISIPGHGMSRAEQEALLKRMAERQDIVRSVLPSRE